MTYLNDLLHRLRSSLWWIAAQFWATALLVLAGVAYTRLPDRYAWQVFLTLLAPVLLIAAFLFLQAGTMRRLLGEERERTPPLWGTLTLLAWVVVFWAVWAILDWCDDQIPLWAGYMNSRAPAHWRAALFTYPHLTQWLTLTEWVLRWIIVPGKVIPYAMASAVSGWRLPVSRVLRVLWNWRWWPVVVVTALISVTLPGHFFAGLPHGTVRLQVWSLAFKLVGSYLLVILGWVLVLAWAAVLLARQPQPPEDAFDQRLFKRLFMGRLWIGAWAGGTLLSALANLMLAHLPENFRSKGWVDLLVGIIVIALVVIVQTGLLRAMIDGEEEHVRFVWGALSMLLWVVPALAVVVSMSIFHTPDFVFWTSFIVLFAVLMPFGAGSAQRALRLPWRRILLVLYNWRWWMGVLLALILGGVLPKLIQPATTTAAGSLPEEIPVLRRIIFHVLSIGSWIVLMGWLAVLFDSNGPSANSPGDDVLELVPVGSGPLGSNSTRLPLPESGDGAGGNA